MAVKIDPNGRRWVQVEAEVPGTVEQVWEAIATGPGVSAWFVPTTMEDDKVTCHFGPGMDSTAKVTAWNPPHSFEAESAGYVPGAPPMATEWHVEAKSGDTCVVRVVHSLFASTDEWDNQLTGTESGWPSFFHVLRTYMTHFRGQKSASFQLMQPGSGPHEELYKSLTGSLGFEDAQAGDHRTSGEDVPPISGTVDFVNDAEKGMLIRLDSPNQGIGFLSTCMMGPHVFASAYFYFYGDNAQANAESLKPVWQQWLEKQCGQPAESASHA